MLFNLSNAWAQSAESRTAEGQAEIKPLQVGDKISEEFWMQEYEFLVSDSITMSNLEAHKGKFLLLDFWATWCSACVKRFPEIDSLQHLTAHQLDVILINREKGENIEGSISKFFKDRINLYPYGFDVSKMINAEKINAMFPHKFIPYYVLIDGEGIILSMGNSKSFNAVRSIITSISERKGGSGS